MLLDGGGAEALSGLFEVSLVCNPAKPRSGDSGVICVRLDLIGEEQEEGYS